MIFGATARIRSKNVDCRFKIVDCRLQIAARQFSICNLQSEITALPANSYRDWAQVGGDVVVLAVQVTEFGVKVHVGANFAGDAATKVVTELVLARVEEIAVDRETAVEAVAPPGEESIAG